MNHEATTSIVGRIAKAAEIGGGGVAIFSALNAQLVIGAIGVVIAVAGFVVNWVYQHKRLQLERFKAGLTD